MSSPTIGCMNVSHIKGSDAKLKRKAEIIEGIKSGKFDILVDRLLEMEHGILC